MDINGYMRPIETGATRVVTCLDLAVASGEEGRLVSRAQQLDMATRKKKNPTSHLLHASAAPAAPAPAPAPAPADASRAKSSIEGSGPEAYTLMEPGSGPGAKTATMGTCAP